MESNKQQQMLDLLQTAKKINKRCDEMGGKFNKSQYNSNGYDNYDLPPESYLQPMNETQYYQEPVTQNENFTEASNKLPKSIFESIINNPIIEHNQTTGISVLDSILPSVRTNPNPSPNYNPNYSQPQSNEPYYDGKQMPSTEELLKRSRQLREQRTPNHTQQPVQQTQPVQPVVNIDYSLIKLMIEDCISKEIRALKKSLLTEGKMGVTNNEIIMTAGDTIRFINKKGDVYEGIVKKTKHINLD